MILQGVSMAREIGHKISPVEVNTYLEGLDYPADRNDLYEWARYSGAPQDILQALRAIEDRTYDSIDDVIRTVQAHQE